MKGTPEMEENSYPLIRMEEPLGHVEDAGAEGVGQADCALEGVREAGVSK